MLLIIVASILAVCLTVRLILHPYITGQKPLHVRKTIIVAPNVVADNFDKIRNVHPPYLKVETMRLADGVEQILIRSNVDKDSKVLATVTCKRIGGTDQFPIVRTIDLNGIALPFGPNEYAVDCFQEKDGQIVLISEWCGEFKYSVKVILHWLRMRSQQQRQAKLAKTLAEKRSAPTTSRQTKSTQGTTANTATENVFTRAAQESASFAPGDNSVSKTNAVTAKSENPLFKYRDEIGMSLLAMASFFVLFSWEAALLIAPLVLLHEYGHLLAYRLTGQTDCRMMLVPFFGGVAIANSEHKKEFDRAFCALMGPGICAPLSVVLAVATVMTQGHDIAWWLAYATYLCAFGNAINMIPILPLDGGHVLQSIARSLSPSQAKMAMAFMTGAGALILFSHGYTNFALIAFATLAFMANSIEYHTPSALNLKSGLFIVGMYLLVLAMHLGAGFYILTNFY